MKQRFITDTTTSWGPVVILSDIEFWNNHYEELKDWCDNNEGELSGMVVTFKQEKHLMLFALKWS